MTDTKSTDEWLAEYETKLKDAFKSRIEDLENGKGRLILESESEPEPIGETDTLPKNKDDYTGRITQFKEINMLKTRMGTLIDILDLVVDLSKPAQKLFIKLKYLTNRKNNICKYSIKNLTDNERKAFDRAMKAIKDANIYKRVKPVGNEEFMLNPYLILPPRRLNKDDDCYLAKYKELWNQL